MMKRFLFALGLCLFALPAWAACGVTNLQVKDNAGTTAVVPYADDGSGASNCSPQIQIKQGGNTAAVKPAATAVGTGDAGIAVVPSPYNALTTTGTGWTSGTAGNSTQTLMPVGVGAPAILTQLVQGSTISGGAVTFECTYDAVPDWVTIPVAQLLNPNTFANLTNPYTLVQSTNQPFLILSQGCQQIRIRLSTTITGSATVTPYTTLLPYNPTIGALLNPLAAGSAIIGKVGIDQTTPGTTNGVNLQVSANGGCTPGHFLSAASNNLTQVKASAGTLCYIEVTQTTTTLGDLRLYDLASAACNSGTGVVLNTAIQSNATSPGLMLNFGPYGKLFANGIGICLTGAVSDNDNTNFVTGVQVNYGYK